MLISLVRNLKTTDGVFGHLSLSDGNAFQCVTLENLTLSIPTGIYSVYMDKSPHFGCDMPHISVPGRIGILFHWANFPRQLEGCIALGERVDGDSIDTSHPEFDIFLAQILPNVGGLQVQISESFA